MINPWIPTAILASGGFGVLDKLIELIRQFGRLFLFWDIIKPWEGGIVLRFGKFHRVAKPGWNWIWPMQVETVISTKTAMQTLVVGPQSLMTKDGKQLVISTVVTCAVVDPKLFIIAIEGGTQALDDAATGVVSELVMRGTFEELKDMNMNLKLTNAIRKLAEPWGVNVARAQIQDFSMTRSYRLLQSMSHVYPERKEF